MTDTPTQIKPTAGRGTVAWHTKTYFHATVEWYVPTNDGSGSSWTGSVSCTHDHETPEAAERCREILARKIERHPGVDPQIDRAVDSAAAAAEGSSK